MRAITGMSRVPSKTARPLNALSVGLTVLSVGMVVRRLRTHRTLLSPKLVQERNNRKSRSVVWREKWESPRATCVKMHMR